MFFEYATDLAAVGGPGGAGKQGRLQRLKQAVGVFPTLTLVVLLALLASHSLTPYSAGVAYVPAGVVPIAWMCKFLWSEFRPSLRRFRNSAALLFLYGVRSYGMDLCGTMALYVTRHWWCAASSPN